ncbi:MAG: 2-oxo-4-hydroxy-4-carboxy-5-ureidoimidazoline decarboxylase [Burkholderiaceae bacterium]|nr:2-oxo-4-hydroxy-4-carboxy-5-ureidoimidazoline decarboxylase [Burkholderiaceae bacterium]
MPTLQQLNDATDHEAVALLDGIYEHTPWVAQRAVASRPFRSLAHLAYALHAAVAAATREEQLALVRVHPELGGRAMVAGTLTADSAAEQSRSGLTHCTPEEFARLRELNATYSEKFGFPFILAVGGPRGTGLGRAEIIATLARRLESHPEVELAECLRNIDRIAELRLAQRFGEVPEDGNWVWDRAEALAVHSDPPFAEAGQLTVTYLTEAHRACARDLAAWMREVGCDEVAIDAVGNVRGRYLATPGRPPAGTVYTGSHYDTVRNGGKYDGRLGILAPLAVVRRLKAADRRLPFHLEVIAFAEEEGQRFPATFLGSSALIGRFDSAWLDQVDAAGTSLRQAMIAAGLDPAGVAACRLDPSDALGFIEVHIEQGPVLEELGLALGVVTSINGSVRFAGEVTGLASHAGTTPMDRRRDAALAVAELALQVEQRAAQDGDSVGTIGVLEVPAGSVNVVPGRCRFTLDLRAPEDGQRDRLVKDLLETLARICARRGLRHRIEETLRVAAAASDPVWQRRWEQAVESLGLPVHRMPSGAGHDAMKMHEAMPQAMLFVRGGNGGISHNPLETITAHDAQRCVDALDACLRQLARDMKEAFDDGRR